MRLLCTSSWWGVLNVVWDLLVDVCKLRWQAQCVGLEKSVSVMVTNKFFYCFLTCAQYYTHACFCRRHIPYSGLFPWGTNFHYFRGSPGGHEIFHPRNLCSAVNMCSIWTGDILLWLFFTTCSALDPHCNPLTSLSQNPDPMLTRSQPRIWQWASTSI